MSNEEASSPFVELLQGELNACDLTADIRSFAAGETIFREGDPGDGLYVISEGRVRIDAVFGQTSRRVLRVFGPGEFFGEMAIIDSRNRSASAVAETDCRLSFVSRDEIIALMEQSPESVLILLRVFSQRMRGFNQIFVQEILEADRLATFGRFARSIVHDIKNPLYVIGMAGDMAAMARATLETRRDAQRRIHKQVDRLVRMLNELLRVTEGPVTHRLEPMDFAVYLQEAVEEVRDEFESRDVKIEFRNPPPSIAVRLNPLRLNHALFNLFNNAADFMTDGGQIMLRFDRTPREVVVEIEDTGRGFGVGVVEKLFTPFFTSGKTNGSGLGLSICKNIIEDHGGRIWAREEPGRGGIFCFGLPLDGE